jgi:hypothetical protein
MQVHLFQGPGRVFGASFEPTGDDLPEKYAPWTAVKTVEMQRGEAQPGLDVEACIDDLETYGVHVTDADVRITEAALR